MPSCGHSGLVVPSGKPLPQTVLKEVNEKGSLKIPLLIVTGVLVSMSLAPCRREGLSRRGSLSCVVA